MKRARGLRSSICINWVIVRLRSFAALKRLSIQPRAGRAFRSSHTPPALKLTKHWPCNFPALRAFDDLTALGAIRALTKAGVKVPEQCSVIGFDDVALSALSAPSLTTVRQPLEAMGTLAVNIIMEGIDAAQEKRDWNITHHRVAPELVIRESTRAISFSTSDD